MEKDDHPTAVAAELPSVVVAEAIQVESKKIPDYKEPNERCPIGSIVSTKAHPFRQSSSNVVIASYNHFTPPLMVVVEKKYGTKYNMTSGEKEDNDSYKCFYYSTLSGTIEENWFKKKELNVISEGEPSFFEKSKNISLEKLKTKFFGQMAILSTVDLELGKQKTWSDSDSEKEKLKVNNLLDFLPPLGTIVDFKFSDDYQKYNEKEGKISHRKSKIMVKLRWLNNITSKYSEDYFPMVGLRLIKKEELELKNYLPSLYYLLDAKIELEGSGRGVVSKIPVKLERVVWNHYYYKYSFTNLFTQTSIESDKVNQQEPSDLSGILNIDAYNRDTLTHFSIEKASLVKDKWYEIEYSDKSERYTKRIVKVIELIEELQEDETKKRILQANCLLRNGKIRHFRVSRIKSYRELNEDFVKTFIGS
ncbi:hypothetical protein [Sphingobacterium sp. LRF_L2]|uniref:hypothetical protein n=1 Tax=Sphingobacterium sp. LRF_L2 TaxID=3369421 RepID=UPI003F5F7B65